MKHTKIIIASILALAMTACTANTNTAEETSQTTESTQSVTESEPYEETTAMTEPETESADTEETAAPEENEETAEAEESVTVLTALGYAEHEAVNITSETKFYECQYSRDNVITSEEDFPDKTLLERAKQIAFEEFERDLAGVLGAGNIASSDDGAGISFDISDVTMTEAMIIDADNDGQDEYILILERKTFPGLDLLGDILMFSDGKGSFTMMETKYSSYSQLYELKYNGFSHIVIDGGENIISSCADFFSFSNGVPKHELRQFRIYNIIDRFLILETAAQAPGGWVAIWDNEAQCYITPEGTDLTESEKNELEEIIKNNEKIDEEGVSGYSIGHIYYYVNHWCYKKTADGYLDLYASDDDGLDWISGVMEYYDSEYMPIIKASGFDYDTALKNMVPLE